MKLCGGGGVFLLLALGCVQAETCDAERRGAATRDEKPAPSSASGSEEGQHTGRATTSDPSRRIVGDGSATCWLARGRLRCCGIRSSQLVVPETELRSVESLSWPWLYGLDARDALVRVDLTGEREPVALVPDARGVQLSTEGEQWVARLPDSRAPVGSFPEIPPSAGTYLDGQWCAIEDPHRIRCRTVEGAPPTASETRVFEVSHPIADVRGSPFGYACAWGEHRVSCWGGRSFPLEHVEDPRANFAHTPSLTPREVDLGEMDTLTIREIAVDPAQSGCALFGEGTLRCWGPVMTVWENRPAPGGTESVVVARSVETFAVTGAGVCFRAQGRDPRCLPLVTSIPEASEGCPR